MLGLLERYKLFEIPSGVDCSCGHFEAKKYVKAYVRLRYRSIISRLRPSRAACPNSFSDRIPFLFYARSIFSRTLYDGAPLISPDNIFSSGTKYGNNNTNRSFQTIFISVPFNTEIRFTRVNSNLTSTVKKLIQFERFFSIKSSFFFKFSIIRTNRTLTA